MRNAGITATGIAAALLASICSHAKVAGDAITITPVDAANAFLFSPKAPVAVRFRIASKADHAVTATLSAESSSGDVKSEPVAGKVKARDEATLTFELGKLAAGFYRMNLMATHEGKTLYQALYPLAVFDRPKQQYKPPLLPIGVYLNGVRHFEGRSPIYLNTYVHAMAQDIRKRHFNTVVVGEPFGPEQVAIFGQYGLSVLARTSAENLLGLEPVIGGILAEDPMAEEVAPLMKKHKALSATTEKPLMICVSGDLAGTKSPQNPMRVWGTIWETLKEGASSVEEMEPHVRRYWHYYPIEYGPSYPILQSYVYRGCLSFMDSLQQAGSGLGYLKPLAREKEEEAEEEKPEKKTGKNNGEKQIVREYFGQIPFWVKLQAFGTARAQSVYKIPTPAQLQTMMHLSLAFGAKGILLNCYQTDRPGHSGMVDPVSLQPVDGRLAAAGQVARQAMAQVELLASARYGGGGVMYTNPFAAPVSISTGSKEEDNLTQYVYVINLNTRAPTSTWLYDLPRVMRDVATGEKLKTEMYETRESSWWGLFLTLKPGQARILEKVDLLPTVHE
ncbi:MAG: hypothetical protein QF473_09915 [Planctomycetota bacterium]|nr:hypothetical protein [Planctomycetota bacterium]